MRTYGEKPRQSGVPEAENHRAEQATRTFLGREVSEEEFRRYGQALAEFFSILKEWARREQS